MTSRDSNKPPFDAELDALRKAGRYDDALKRCEHLLHERPSERTEVLRQRSRVFSMQDRHDEAIADRHAVLARVDARFGDLYMAAWYTIEAGRYADAARLFDAIIERGRTENETWFASASWMYLSFAQTQLGALDEADASLDVALSLERDPRVPLGHDWLSAERIRADISRARRAR